MISLKTFTGEFPRTASHLLPDTAASSAVDCDFTANVLTGLHNYGISQPTGVPGTASAFVYSNSDSGSFKTKTYAWAADVDAVRGPIANDAYDRMYWTSSANSHVQVTRNALSGKDLAPAAADTFLVGVPVPTVAPITSDAQGVILGGAALTDVRAICETETGAVASSVSIFSATYGYTALTKTTKALQLSFNYNPTCKLYSGASSAQVGSLPTGFSLQGQLTAYSAPPSYAGSVYDYSTGTTYSSYSLGGAAITLVGYTNGGDYYIRYNDWAFAPLGSVLYVPSGTAHVQSGFLAGLDGSGTPMYQDLITGYRTYTHIGGGWYCTNKNAQSPSTAFSVSTFAVQLYFGSTLVTLRESSNRSSFPESGLTGFFTLDNGKLTVYLNRTASSTYTDHRAYVYTYVNIFGEEGAPSPVMETDVAEGDYVTVTASGANANGYVPLSKIRLYRTATGSASTDYLLLAELDHASSVEYVDKKLASELVEPLSTVSYYPPEADLKGLTVLPNGILAAFKNNEIHFCEPYLPYAWKPENVLTTLDAVVGLVAAEGGFYVVTRSHPYFVAGVTPDAMGQQKLTAIQAGVSKNAICNIGPVTMWASNDGLVTARGLDASLDYSSKFFTRNDWRRLFAAKLDKMRLSAHDGSLVIWFSDGTPGYLLRYDESEPTLTELSRGFYAACVDPKGDALLVSLDGVSLSPFRQYDAGRLDYSWTSKTFVLPAPLSFGVCQVVGSGEVVVRVFGDGTLVKEKSLALDRKGQTMFRLAGDKTHREWAIQLLGQGEVLECNLAISPTELINV